jgi:hypothetical protein
MSDRSADPRLATLDALLAAEPGQADALYLRAGLLAEQGRAEDARRDYMAVIAIEPAHFGALNDLGTLLFNTDFRAAARLAYAEAIKHHPDNPIGHINLANALLANDEIGLARTHFETALALAPEHPDAHQGLANLLQTQGEDEAAARHRQRSYAARTITTTPWRGTGAPRQVLKLVSAVGGNIPTRFLLDEAVFQVSTLAVEAWRDEMTLPDRNLVFNAIGDPDLSAEALDIAEVIIARVGAPVVNAPDRVRSTGRADNARQLLGLPGVVTPRIEPVALDGIEIAAEAFGYPLLLRSPGFHTGQNFEPVAGPENLADAAARLPGRNLMLIQPLDARDALGRFRKFRTMIVGGRLYPLHLAISDSWKVHYFTADMAEKPEHRAEEAAFLADMPAVLGPLAMTGLRAIADRLRLDYAGVDFGLGPNGEVLLFEANATMVVNPPDPDPRWDYRRGPVDAVLAAVREMLVARIDEAAIAASSPPGPSP